MSTTISRAVNYLLHNPLQFVDSCVRNFGFLFPDKLYLSLRYRCQMGKWIDWKNPRTFTEKLNWLKVYDVKPEYTIMVDKYAAKEYVASIIGEEYIIPTLGVWDKVEDIDWDILPNQFVIKTTHAGGGGGVVICKDKRRFDKENAIDKLSRSMRIKPGQDFREKPYMKVPKRILAEKYMTDASRPDVDDLVDYKFFCFDGQPRYCQVIRDRRTNETIDFYDMDWNHMPFVGLNPVARNGLTPVARPVNLEIMKEICCKLSKDMKFSRIDLYEINGKEYFGEITFYPAGGFGEFTPKEWNERLGDLVNLNGVNRGGVICRVSGNCIEYFRANDNAALKDYKFFCFDGVPRFLYVSDSSKHESIFLNTDWSLAGIGRDDYKALKEFPAKPENLTEMLNVARKLSAGLPHIRIDLYDVCGKVYFGEMTFYTGGGFIPFNPKSCDTMIGNMLKLPKL